MTGRPDYDVGDLVVCVNAEIIYRPDGGRSLGGRRLTLGRVYRACAFAQAVSGPVVILVEVRSGDRTGGFRIDRFRKVDPLPDTLTSLLASTPRERVDA